MRQVIAVAFVTVMLAVGSAMAGDTFYVDPQKGSGDGDGSAAKPWKTLAEVASGGQLKKVKGGDTILLRSGYHGSVSFSGDNAQVITIAAEKGQRPTLSRLEIPSGKNWCVKGLVVSPSFGDQPYKGSIVSFGDGGPSSDIAIEDCCIFTVEDASKWDAQQWMSANSGASMGRNGRKLVLRNNYILNTRFGVNLSAFDSLCEGNVISDFSADAIRATRDGEVIQYNIIKNVYVSDSDGDKNHDDGIQCFLHNKGTGTVNKISVIGNIIIAHEDANQKLKNSLQGIGFFDGPLVDFVVTDNVVGVDAWHGIALFDAQNALVERNVVWTPIPSGNARAWITFGTKQKLAKDNTAKNNFACSYKLNQPGTVEENNKPSSQAIYDQAMAKTYKTICDKFGRMHVAANRPRMGDK